MFADSLSAFFQTMHFNGQTMINLKSETEADGIVYCSAYHYSKDGDIEKLMISPIHYEDLYKKIGNTWLFAERKLKVRWMGKR